LIPQPFPGANAHLPVWRPRYVGTTLGGPSTAPRSGETYIVTSPLASPRARVRALAAAFAVLAAGSAGAVPARAADPVTSNFDARPKADSAGAPARGEAARAQLRDQLGRLGTLSLDPRSQTVRAVGRLDGFLTGPSGRDGAAVALGYVRANAAALGLDVADVDGLRLVSRSFTDGVEHLKWEQRYGGVPVADAGLDAAVTGAGRLVSVTGPPAHDVAVRSLDPAIDAREAYSAARASGGVGGTTPAVTTTGHGPEQKTEFRGGGSASLALFRSGDGHKLGWRVLAPVSSTGVYDVLVDARSGEVVRRANLVKFAVNAKVFRNNPATTAQQDVDVAPWLSPGATTLSGPNAHAFLDLNDTVSFGKSLTPAAGSDIAPGAYTLSPVPSWGAAADADGCPSATATFPTTACTWDPRTPGSWATNKNQSATQLFYLVNAFHDHLRDDPGISFGDDEGAFTGGDPVLAQAMDGADGPNHLPDASHANNSNYLTLPDGAPGLLQTYLWQLPFGGYDGANDAAMVWHEQTHGMTDRLVTDARGYGALTTPQSAAISEGLSDWYAMDLVVGEGLQADGGGGVDVRFGKYFDNENAGSSVRFQSLDCPTSAGTSLQCRAGLKGAGGGGFTLGDFGRIDSAGPEVHADGEIIAETLWQLRQRLIANRGAAAGANRARQYVTGALRIVPPEPSYLDLRNAILQTSTEDDALIWSVFANRGMGYFASVGGSSDTSPAQDFTEPAELSNSADLTGHVTDENDQPVAGATVAVSGHDTGLGEPLVSQPTGANGAYRIDNLPVRPSGDTIYPVVRASKPGYATGEGGVTFNQPTEDLPLQVERDFSSADGTASIRSYSGPDNTSRGCGPRAAVDDSPSTVWGTNRVTGGQTLVVDMGMPIDVGRIAIDPSAGCGDDANAALGEYQVLGARGPDGPFTSIKTGALTAANNGKLNDVYTGTVPGVRYVMLRAITPQSGNGSGAQYIDVAELHVGRSPGSLIGPSVTTGAAIGVGTGSATATAGVAAHDQGAQVVFEYGTTAGYGATVNAGSAPAGAASTPVAAALSGLAPSTTYHYRAVAIVGSDRYPGADATFTTAATPAPTPAPTPGPPTTAPATPTQLLDTKLKADGKGMVKAHVSFGSQAPAGTARLRIIGRRTKVIATGTLTVRPGGTATKTMRLTKRGRKQIRRGKTRTVVLELRLPSGQKLKRTLRLARAKR
jgi:extracellular elastinolytic metalloproteinase